MKINLNYIIIFTVSIIILATIFYLYSQGQKNESVKTLNPNELRPGPIVHEELSAEQTEKIKKIHSAFADVYTISLEETITNFKRDRNPDNEINIWLNMLSAYEKFISKEPEIKLDKKTEVFKLILMRSMMDEKEAKTETACKILTETEISEIFNYYKLESKPITIERQ